VASWRLAEWASTAMPLERFMPHGKCFLWNTRQLTLHVVSDAFIALAYRAANGRAMKIDVG
jgi:hypothetical protein